MTLQDTAEAFILEFHDGTHEVVVTYYATDGVGLVSLACLDAQHGARLVQFIPLPGADWETVLNSNVRRRFPGVAIIDMPLV